MAKGVTLQEAEQEQLEEVWIVEEDISVSVVGYRICWDEGYVCNNNCEHQIGDIAKFFQWYGPQCYKSILEAAKSVR